MTNEERTYVGIIECPVHRGYVRFEFSAKDTVKGLKHKVAEIWGSPRSKLKGWGRNDTLTARRGMLEGGFMEEGAWVVLCENEDATYSVLGDDDRIPTSPPTSTAPPHGSVLASRPGGIMGRHIGLIHKIDMRGGTPLSYHFDEDYVDLDPKEYDIKLVALVLITGG